MSGLFSRPSAPQPVTVSAANPGGNAITPTTPPEPGNSAAATIGQGAASALSSGLSTGSTVLTSGLGTSAPTVAKKALLGG